MKNNPYVTRNGEPLPDFLKFRGQSQPAIASSGIVNASSKKDLMVQIGNLITAATQGDIVPTATKSEIAAQRRDCLVQASTNRKKWDVIGEAMSEDIQETVEREGFVRAFMNCSDLAQGDIARVRYKRKNVTAVTAAAKNSVTPSIVRNEYVYIPEFYVDTRILMEERDIHQTSSDVLDEKYNDGLEAIMVAEDKLWKAMADTACTIENDLTYFTTFTPLHLTQIRSQVTSHKLPAAHCLLAYDLWDDIIGTSGFSDWFSPIEQHELILEGKLGTMLSMNMMTDAFRVPELKVLNAGDIYVISTPETHGAFMQRGDLSSNPIDGYGQGTPERGWYIFEMVAMQIINARSVAAGRRT